MEYFRTTNLKLAGVLKARGFKLHRIERTANPKRVAFYFENAGRCRTARAAHYKNEVLVSSLRLAHAMRDLREQADDIVEDAEDAGGGGDEPDPSVPRLVVRVA